MSRPTVSIRPVETDSDLAEVRTLFEEYVAALDHPLTFQDFEEELAGLPGDYVPPSGRLLVATVAGRPAGCVALRRLEDRVCEMKRLFVRSHFRGLGLGRALVDAVISEAKSEGYETMRLDTLPSQSAAQRLYESLGFVDIEAYRYNPVTGTRFLELRW